MLWGSLTLLARTEGQTLSAQISSPQAMEASALSKVPEQVLWKLLRGQ